MARSIRGRFDNAIGNVIKSSQQMQAEHDITATNRAVAADKVINKSLQTGQPIQARSLSLKQDIANALARNDPNAPPKRKKKS